MTSSNWPFLGLRDPISAATHLFACLFAIFAAGLLWRLCRGERRKQLKMACFGLSMVALYGASGIYHALSLPAEQLQVFQRLDHSAIYLLIAGTYTPTFGVLLGGLWRRRFFVASVWALALAGITCQWAIPDAPYWVEIMLYFILGWVALVPIVELFRAVGFRGMQWAFYGGVFYTLGGVSDLIEWPVVYPRIFGPHELFHIFVMAGTFCHIVFMVCHVAPFTYPMANKTGPRSSGDRGPFDSVVSDAS